MKRKGYTKTKVPFTDAVKHVVSEFSPLYEKTYAEFRKTLEKKPQSSFLIMMAILVINFGIFLMVSFNKPPSEKHSISTAIKKATESVKAQPENRDIPFTLSNYIKIKKLRDSLVVLMNKKSMTHSDTLQFIKLVEEFNRLSKTEFNTSPSLDNK